ncbi:alpha-L-rhamnosidase [Pedobacter helvus]|uniref:alpha-L-rhamnosidase n=1 Tax=Pedobacter helvus TaxID=2563444 RepID=A0ABW9JMG0_9SPHI|nr:alpha-L-rhamnosidase [Pedobacter ureilyticus]
MRKRVLVTVTMLLFSFGLAFGQIAISNLRCELLVNPIGIDMQRPSLSWEITSLIRNTNQIAYQILVSENENNLAVNKGDVWDSGKTASDSTAFVSYKGKKLKKDTRYYWKIKIWTNQGEGVWSATAYWHQGLMNYKDWAATQVGEMPFVDWGGRWIGFDRMFPWDGNQSENRLSARYFRKEFKPVGKVKSATAYIIGLGLYELYINGKKIGNHVLAPIPTDYTKNVKYNAFDVKENLKEGINAIGVVLGNGRYYTMRQLHQEYKIKTFGFPKLLFNLVLKYEDGTETVVFSDNTWKGTADGPIRSNNEYDGENYDATKEMLGWNKVGFDDSKWLKAEFVQEPGGNYEAQMSENMKVMDSIPPVSITKIAGDRYIIDFGQNMTGWMKFAAQGKKGEQVKLRYAESLTPNGELAVANLRDAKAQAVYTLKGSGKEFWEPSFTYYGFRYVEVSGYPGTPTKENFVAKMVYDDVRTVGTFKSSNPLLNQIYKNVWWGTAGNYKGMPVDCPQRNERQPWLGDRGIGTIGENFMFDNARIYKKLVNDIKLAQKADGSLPDVAPDFWRYYSDNITWPGVMLLITDMLHQQTGDVAVVRETYPVMHKWLRYMKDRFMTTDYILNKDSYGDWCAPPATIEAGRGISANQKFPSPLISTAYYYHFTNMMAGYAAMQNKTEDVSYYKNLGKKIKEAFNITYYKDAGYYGKGELTDNLLPLYFEMVAEPNVDKVFQYVVNTIKVKNQGHLSTGVIGTQWLMRTLSKYGRADIALQIATKKTYPSWGYMIENGATTIWELWNGNTAAPDMNSQNHVMMVGDLVVWYYQYLAGIQSSVQNPGFRKIIMSPEFVHGLDFVQASHQAITGLIKSEWKREKGKITWTVAIPSNSTAEIHIPSSSLKNIQENSKPISSINEITYLRTEKGRQVFEVPSGNYVFKF